MKTASATYLHPGRTCPTSTQRTQLIHDYRWLNGNVPIALCRWELLGLADELDAIGVVAAGS